MKKLIIAFLISTIFILSSTSMAAIINIKFMGNKNWENLNGVVAGEYIIESTQQKYDTFCFDPYQHAPPKGIFKTYNKVLPSNDSEKHALWIYDDYRGLINPTSHQAATYQAAIWSIFKPSLDFYGNSNIISGLYSSLLSSDERINSGYYMLKNDCYQDFAIPENQVPIPGAIWLLGSGLLAIIGFKRKKG